MDIYDISLTTLQGNTIGMAEFKGKVLLVVNTASKCGFTPQFAGLQTLYEAYRDKGFCVLGFPCNQFAGQEPGSVEEIHQVCAINYGVTFPMFEKIDVNGKNTHPLFRLLKEKQPGLAGKAIKWNFTKFLVDRSGSPVKRYAPVTKPEKIANEIESLLF
nr:glutathione peroxidase [uncultured Desulfobacter sp.]